MTLQVQIRPSLWKESRRGKETIGDMLILFSQKDVLKVLEREGEFESEGRLKIK